MATPGGAQPFPAGQGCTLLHWTGLGWAGLDWAALGWTGPGCLVSVRLGIALSRQPLLRCGLPFRAELWWRGAAPGHLLSAAAAEATPRPGVGGNVPGHAAARRNQRHGRGEDGCRWVPCGSGRAPQESGHQAFLWGKNCLETCCCCDLQRCEVPLSSLSKQV